jgi:hypothetical protein
VNSHRRKGRSSVLSFIVMRFEGCRSCR